MAFRENSDGRQWEPRVPWQFLRLNAAAVLACLMASILLAQNPTATLVGTVRDNSGAVVTGAALEVRNTDTGITRKAASDEKGEFTIPNLVPGPYEVTIAKAGFRSVRETNMVLVLDQTARMEFRLQVGAISQSVEVTAVAAPLINTENGAKGEVMTASEIVEMPLNGRSINDLAFLVPGVLPNTPGAQGGISGISGFAINGARPDDGNFVVDGFGGADVLYGGPAIIPNLDALQEFKMQTSNFSAEYGRKAGGVMSMVLKTGGNQIHGSLFEFVRNDMFDARNFFGQNKPELRRNQFGGVLTGPVRIPKLYSGHDRTFFLFNWESYRQVQGSPALGVVPTLAQRAGDFSQTGPIADPLSTGSCGGSSGKGACFPGNMIPQSRLSPQASAAQAFYPHPNLTGLNNFSAATPAPNFWNSFILKIDQRIFSSDTLSFRYTTRSPTVYNPNFNPIATNSNNTGLFGQLLTSHLTLAGLTYTHLFGPTLINELRLGFVRSGGFAWGTSGGSAPGPYPDYNAKFGIAGLTTNPQLIGLPLIYPAGYQQVGPGSNYPSLTWTNQWTPGDTLTWVKGSHLIKAGVDVQHSQTSKLFATNSRGTFQFTGYWTGQSYADFLLGYLDSASRLVGGGTIFHPLQTSYGSFLQDDWKVSKRLTLNFGLRWEINKPPEYSSAQVSNFLPNLKQEVIGSSAALQRTGITIANPAQVTTADKIGLPQPLVYTSYKAFAPRFGFAWRPFGGNRMVVRGGYGIFYGGQPLNAIATALGGGFPFTSSQTVNRNTTDPTVLTLANPFPVVPNLTANLASLTITGFELRPPSPYLQSWNLTIEREIGFSSALKASYVGSKGTHLGVEDNLNQPYNRSAALPGGVIPYPGFGTINYFSFPGNSVYQGGTLTWQRRFVHGFFYTVNYTYSKSIDDTSVSNGAVVQNVLCITCERGRSAWDIGHAFAMNFSWQSPFRGVFARGWQFASTAALYTGVPFTPTVTNSNLNLGQASRPNRIGKGTVANPNPTQWFNVADFPAVTTGAFAFGNSGRDILDGPGNITVNLALYKNFVVLEKSHVQFRWELFNVLNHANFGLPAVAVNAVNAGTLLSANPGRQMQFALRLSF